MTDNCTFNTPYMGGGQGSYATPWGVNCSGSEIYCPIYASCIPSSEPCSLQALSSYLTNNTNGYFGQTCAEGEQFCPGTQSCILNTTSCTYNDSLTIVNITCPSEGWSYCIDERTCTNQTCTSPVRQSFSFNDSETGKLFYSNFPFYLLLLNSIAQKPIGEKDI